MGNLKITEVPQAQSVAESNDFYVKIGNNFRRVSISALITLLETSLVTSGFVKTSGDGITQDKLAAEPVVISPDSETPGAYVSSRTADQIYQSFSDNFEIQPEYEYWLDANTPVNIRGAVLDVSETASVFAFLDFAAATPSLMIATVENYSVTVAVLPLTGGGGGGVVPAPGVGDEGKVPMVVNGVVVWAAIPETTTSEIDAIIAAI